MAEEKAKPVIRTTMDNMEAYMYIPAPEDGETYTVPELMQALQDKGICAGIDEQKLEHMIAEQVYDHEQVVARGIKAIDGIDGYYEYNFNIKTDNKPAIKPDGTVDYWSVNAIESVVANQVIAVYHPTIEGSDGMTVKGGVIPAKKGRDQLPIKGKGFERMEDGVTYRAVTGGKIEMQNDRIVILPVYELQGDVDLNNGNIDFHGDIVIHGGVESGVNVKSTGTITIDGVVEDCRLEAGKDIILKSGMVGGTKASIKTKGNITAKFIQFTTIECDGNIQADVMMDCNVHCLERVVMNGVRGSILGGRVQAIQGFEVTTLGNEAEKKTEIIAGASVEVYSRLRVLDKKIQATAENLQKIEEGLKRFKELEIERGVSYRDDPRRMSLLRESIRDTANLAADTDEKKRLEQMVVNSREACVSVLRDVNPGVIIRMGDLSFVVKNSAKSVEFYKLSDKIAIRACHQGVE